MNGGKIIEEEQNTNACLMEARLQFRNLLEEFGLVLLAGSEADALSWLEGTIAEVVYGVTKRQRFLGLLKQAREVLNRERGARHPDGNSPGGERKERPNPHSGKRFRRIKIL